MTSKNRRTRRAALIALVGIAGAGMPGGAALGQRAPEVKANWALANKFSQESVRDVIYSSTVNARFINKTDSAWYQWKDRNGSRFMLVVPKTRTKQPLFDHSRLAADLTALHHKPFVPHDLPFTTIEFPDSTNASVFEFRVDSMRYSYDLRTGGLKSLGRAPRDSTAGNGGAANRGGGGGGRGGNRPNQDFRNFSPDSTAFVFAREHNLYYVDVERGDTVQISKDGVENYSFGARDTTQQRQQQRDDDEGEGDAQTRSRSRDPRVRASVTWSKDSRAFYVTRTDQRDVADLYLIDMLAEPRPKLTTYKYPMPGEENVRKSELWVYKRANASFEKLDYVEKWKDQSNSAMHWDAGGSDKLRLVRRDRLRQNMELIEVDVGSRAIKVLLSESVQGATLEGSPVGISYRAQYVNEAGDFVWWSERTGWGHFYLYAHDGTLKNSITSGPWRAEEVVEIDSIKRIAWIRGVGREPDENVYQQHLYRVNLDGSGIALLDAGDANHNTIISPSKRFLIDNYSRPDLLPKAVVRDERGSVLFELETADVSRLQELGWKLPETFIVKAADGVTDIYGNMWKPFDFDPSKKYPIIANVYPGPQTESVSTTFSANPVPQRLAQLGFIVIQIGNRGGSPRRSNAYQSYSYQNLRDYGLADKKAGIEQLAARYSFIDIDRVGLYGHSGGGFMTAAAMLLPPYNDFFKVGVSSAGNHDNNVYGDYWAEQNHGLREVTEAAIAARGNGNGRGSSARGNGRASNDRGNADSQGDAGETSDKASGTRFEIKVPANHELAANLKGKLLLVHGDMDNNVHPAGTIRLVNALIKANKRFDFMVMPGKAHGFGDMQEYFHRMMFEYFAEHLLGDYYRSSASY